MKNLRLTVRLKETDRNKMEQLIQKGKFKNLSDLLRQAITRFLEVKP